jgi:hypothetical protein
LVGYTTHKRIPIRASNPSARDGKHRISVQKGTRRLLHKKERKTVTMSDQHENESITLEEVRQSLLTELDATKQAIAELSNEQLEEVGGAAGGEAGWRQVLSCITCGDFKPYKPVTGTSPGLSPNLARTNSTNTRSPLVDERTNPEQKQKIDHATLSSQIPESVKGAMIDWAHRARNSRSSR